MISGLRPLVLVLLALLSGLLPALRFGSPSLVLLGGCVLTLLWMARGVIIESAAAIARPRWDASLLAAFALLGGALGGWAEQRAASDCRLELRDGMAVTALGVLGASSRAPHSSGSSPLLPLEMGIISADGAICRARLRIRLPADVELPAGSRLELAGEWIRGRAAVTPSRWPSDPFYAGFLATDTVVGVHEPRPGANPLLWARGRAEERLGRLFPRHFALAEALVLGRREHLESDIRERFVRAGLIHLLAISGAHVGLLAGMLLLAGNLLRIGRQKVRMATIGCTALYLLLIGAPGSAVRAGIMLSLALLARILQRPAATMPMMAAAALALLVWNPLAVLHPGVQLSFAGVSAIVLAGRLSAAVLPQRFHGTWRGKLADAGLASLSAFLLTSPITAHHFGTVSPVSVLSNLPAIPLVSLALASVVASLVLVPVPASILGLLADGGAAVLDLLDRVARAAADVPFGYVSVQRPNWALWGVLVGAALTGARVAVRARRWVRWTMVCGLVLATALVWPALKLPGADGVLEIHALDVGQGDAFAIRTPAGRWILIDAGPRVRDFDAGARRVLPFLRAKGVRSVEALILTHPDADHIGGAAAIVRGLRVHRIIEPGVPVGKEIYLDLLTAVEETGAVWTRAEAGRSLTIDGLEFRFIWPDARMREQATVANDASVVVHLRFGSFAALFPGDVPAEVERELVAREGNRLRAQVLMAAHHGSRTSSSDALLEAVQPELVVISCGRRNRYGHPAPEVLARLERRGIQIARTDREGTISLRVSPRESRPWQRHAP